MKTNIVWGFVGAWIVSLAIAIVSLTPQKAVAQGGDPYGFSCAGCDKCTVNGVSCPKLPGKVCSQNNCMCQEADGVILCNEI